MISQKIVQQLALGIALMTAFGVFVHDTKVDRAATTFLSLPVIGAVFDANLGPSRLGNESHTHIERVSAANAIRALSTGAPRVQPTNDHRRYVLLKKVARGTLPFDGYFIPAVS